MVSYIMTYRQTTLDRHHNLMKVLEWLKNFDFEIVIVEQDSYSKLVLPSHIKHFFIKNDGLFNRSKGFNHGIHNTVNPILFFADSDMIVRPEVIQKTVELMKTYDTVSPFSFCIDLSKEETDNFELASFKYDLQKTPRGGMNFCSGIVAFTRKAIAKIYNWDERFKGWGGEDDIQFMKTKQLLNYKMLYESCYHLYHSRSTFDGTNQHPNYQNNLKLFFYYRNNVAQLLKDMKTQTP
jgi:cellulose synthase/poly-beta-1,6-N-acetylglucosamine synthase-like glycosyltransferase